MPKFRSVSTLLFLITAILSISALLPKANGQTLASTASFSGSVSDSSGARVANANVALSSPEKGVTRVFKTDAEGNFSFSLLPAGAYTLTVQATGFRTFKQEGLTLEVGQNASQNVTLTIGATEQIEVAATTPLLQTEDANVGAQVSSKMVAELPLNLRNVFNFVTLNSSVNNLSQSQVLNGGGEQGSADQDVSFFNFGGGFFGTTAFLLDGAWDTSQGWGGVIYVPSPDNVQEFKVQQNSFTSQYGWSTGNVITVLTKSGSSTIHGDAYEFMRNGALDANSFFSNLQGLPRPNEHRNQFGFAIGGPVYIPKVYQQRNKTFFFFNYEGHRENDPAPSGLGTVPTVAMRTGDFSALLGAQIGTDALCRPILAGELYDPFTTTQVTATCATAQNTVGQTVYIRNPIAGNNIANSTNGINPVGQKLINYYPQPLTSALVNNWSASGLVADTSNEFSVRIDHNFTDNTRIYGRFSDKHESKGEAPDYYGATNPAGPGQTNPNNRWNFAVGVSQVFSPTFTMSANVGAMWWNEKNVMASYGFQPSSLGLPSFIDPYSPQFPVINAAGYESEGPLAGAGEASFPRDSGTASVDFAKVRGNHKLSFGYMAVAVDENGGRITPTTFSFNNGFSGGPNPQAVTTGTGDAMASTMLGTAYSGGTGIYLSQVTRTWFHGLYLQDDWKVRPKLTLNLGLRWEVQVPIRERFNRQAQFDYNAVNPITAAVNNGTNYSGELVFSSSSNRGLYNTDFKNFAPRIGFAYQVLPKLVMRGGYGIFYAPNYRNNPPEPGYTSATPFIASTNSGLTPSQTLSTAFGGGLVPIVGNSLGGLTDVGYSIGSAVAPNRKTFYVNQWMYGFQYAPTSSDVIDFTYVGNRGIHVITGSLNYNQLNPSYFSMGNALLNQVANPFFGHITSSGCSGYDLSAATVPQAALLRPHPEFCDINETDAPGGDSYYDALQVNYTHRVSRGLTLLASYTFSKFIDDVTGPEGWASTSPSTTRNVYDLGLDRSVDATDTPHSVVLSYVYEIPVGRGKQFGSGMNGVMNAIVGGWQTTGIATLKQGFPLGISSPGNGLNYFGAGQNVDVVGDYHVPNPYYNGWFNTSAFAIAAPWTLGDAPRYFSNLRAPNYDNWDMGIQKFFPIKENLRIQFRVDFFNAFNHANFYAPNMSFGSGEFGKITETYTPRLTQAVLKVYW
jgi:Carboxypeptidase regulatory-like domain/TonB dependent receptor